jgi:hypothetical protein
VDDCWAVLLNFRKVLPPEWHFQIFHSPINVQWIRSVYAPKESSSGAVRLTLSTNRQQRSGGRKGHAPHVTARESYLQRLQLSLAIQRILASCRRCQSDAYALVCVQLTAVLRERTGEYVLTFQADSALCANSPFKVVDFLIYDYVGAPWDGLLGDCGNGREFLDVACISSHAGMLKGTTGGLSLRHKPTIMQGLSACPTYDTVQEDDWFCDCFYQLNKGGYPVSRANYNTTKAGHPRACSHR